MYKTKTLLHILCVCLLLKFYKCQTNTATKGEVWPKPVEMTKSDYFYIVKPLSLAFDVTPKACTILEVAVARYQILIRTSTTTSTAQEDYSQNPNFKGYLTKVSVVSTGPCPTPSIPPSSMKESYSVVLKPTGECTVEAPSVWGIMRGLETLSQLMFPANTGELKIYGVVLNDGPRFPYRGLMLDTSRHFFGIPKIMKILDGMAYNKLNVFHWHVTDDPSFPFKSQSFPQLSSRGAFSSQETYSPLQVQKIIRYGANRGIRVLPEFDTPGHTKSWAKGMPELMTRCYNILSGPYGPINPINDFTYYFLINFYKELSQTFPDQHFHLGGNELDFSCWETNPDIRRFMKEHNIENGEGLENYYFQKLTKIVNDLQATTLVWEDVFTNGVVLPKSTIIEVWKDMEWQSTMLKVTSAGHPAILSACWYAEDFLLFTKTWKDFYQCEPYDLGGTDANKNLVFGGEIVMLTQYTTENNVEQKIWPKGCATAEKLWSAENAGTVETVSDRLEEQACRMKKRDMYMSSPYGSCPP